MSVVKVLSWNTRVISRMAFLAMLVSGAVVSLALAGPEARFYGGGYDGYDMSTTTNLVISSNTGTVVLVF